MKRLQKFSLSLICFSILGFASASFAGGGIPKPNLNQPVPVNLNVSAPETLPSNLQETVNNLPGLDNPSQSTSAPASGASFKQCQQDHDTAQQACGNKDSDAGMAAYEKMMFAQQMAAMTSGLSQAMAQKGSAAACMITDGLGAAVQMMSALKQGSCSRTYKTCMKTCGDYLQQTTTTDPQAKLQTTADATKFEHECAGDSVFVAMMQQQEAAALMTALQGMNCQGQQSAKAQQQAPPPAALATATGDCSNPAFATTSPACICQANPSDPVCSNGANNGLTPSTTGLAGAGGLATPSITTPGEDIAAVDTSKLDVGDQRMKGNQATGANGAGGAGLPGGGPGGAPFGGEGDGTAAQGIDKNVITGVSNGGGGVAALGAGGGGGGGVGAKASGADESSGFNLAKYLPKSLFKNRGLAGMSVPATDGVTGPTGPSIWEKVHARYESTKSTLIPEK